MPSLRRAESAHGPLLLELRPGPRHGAAQLTSPGADAPDIPPLPSLPADRRPAVEAALAGIAAADPGFDRFAFLNDAKRRLAAVKQAATAWRPDSCRGLMTSRLYDAWSAQIADRAAQRVRNMFDDLQVADPQIMWALPGPPLQHVTLQMNAMAAVYTVSDATGQVVFGDPHQLHGFTEYWTFSRPAATRTSPPSAARSCSVCGAPLTGDALFCRYCTTAAVATEGWLVSRIDEELRWADD